jgi:CRP/FNR family transcriptional regulator, cyclic AMP receptor protein
VGEERDARAYRLVRRYQKTWPPGSFLACLAQDVVNELVADREVTRFKPGEDLVVEGQPAGEVFLLMDAIVKVTVRFSGGITVLAVLAGGDITGEMAVAEDSACSATVTACRYGAEAVAVPGEEFKAVMGKSPAAAMVLAADLSCKLRAANRRRADFVARKVPARLARLLAEMAEEYGQPVPGRPELLLQLGFPQEEFATLIGAREAAVSAALKDLRGRGILEWGYRGVTIFDMDALRAAHDAE